MILGKQKSKIFQSKYNLLPVDVNYQEQINSLRGFIIRNIHIYLFIQTFLKHLALSFVMIAFFNLTRHVRRHFKVKIFSLNICGQNCKDWLVYELNFHNNVIWPPLFNILKSVSAILNCFVNLKKKHLSFIRPIHLFHALTEFDVNYICYSVKNSVFVLISLNGKSKEQCYNALCKKNLCTLK